MTARALLVAAAASVAASGCGLVTFNDARHGLAAVANLDFEGGTHSGAIPSGWLIALSATSGRPDLYSFAVDGDTTHGGDRSLRIRNERPVPAEGAAHGGVYQCIRAPEIERRTVRLSGWIKTDRAAGDGASLWLGAYDADRETIDFENMEGRRVTGSTDWGEHEVDVTLPPGVEVAELCYGFFGDGPGAAWVDDLELVVEGDLR